QGASFGVDGAGGMKTKDWEIFMEHFASKEGKPLRQEFASIGMKDIEAPLEAITGDLEKLRATHAKTPSSKSLELIGTMEQGIDEMKKSNNAFQSIFNEASEQEELSTEDIAKMASRLSSTLLIPFEEALEQIRAALGIESTNQPSQGENNDPVGLRQ
ncbi:hypothetical protein LCGC14_2743540, partial [marine sediment metagenome]